MTPKPAAPQSHRWREPQERCDEAQLRVWMIGYQEGRLEAFDELYAALAPSLRRYLTSLTRSASEAEDLLQEAFLQIHRSRRTYDPDLPLLPWVFAITRHVHRMSLRRRRTRPAPTAVPADPEELPVPAEVEGLADRLEVRRALGQIGEDRREALLLHHVWGFRFREIAGILGITETAAKLRSSRAMSDLRSALGAPASGTEER